MSNIERESMTPWYEIFTSYIECYAEKTDENDVVWYKDELHMSVQHLKENQIFNGMDYSQILSFLKESTWAIKIRAKSPDDDDDIIFTDVITNGITYRITDYIVLIEKVSPSYPQDNFWLIFQFDDKKFFNHWPTKRYITFYNTVAPPPTPKDYHSILGGTSIWESLVASVQTFDWWDVDPDSTFSASDSTNSLSVFLEGVRDGDTHGMVNDSTPPALDDDDTGGSNSSGIPQDPNNENSGANGVVLKYTATEDMMLLMETTDDDTVIVIFTQAHLNGSSPFKVVTHYPDNNIAFRVKFPYFEEDENSNIYYIAFTSYNSELSGQTLLKVTASAPPTPTSILQESLYNVETEMNSFWAEIFFSLGVDLAGQVSTGNFEQWMLNLGIEQQDVEDFINGFDANVDGIITKTEFFSFYGIDFNLENDLNIPALSTLIIPFGVILNIDDGLILTNLGTINNNGGTINNDGTIINSGTFNNYGETTGTSPTGTISGLGWGDPPYTLETLHIAFNNNTTVTLNNYLTISSSETLTIPNGKILIIEPNVVLTNDGTINNNGAINNDGTINNNGAINNEGTINNDQGITIGLIPTGSGNLSPDGIWGSDPESQNIIGLYELNLVLNNWGKPGTITLT